MILDYFYINSPDAVIDPWSTKLWERILELIPLPPEREIISSTIK